MRVMKWASNNIEERRKTFMEQWFPFIQEVGFPVVVTFYLLHRIETKLDRVIESIQSIPEKMAPEQVQVKKSV